MIKIKIDNEWAKCGECGHKLFKITGAVNGIEIKCHSCKAVNTDDYDAVWDATFGYEEEKYKKFNGI